MKSISLICLIYCLHLVAAIGRLGVCYLIPDWFLKRVTYAPPPRRTTRRVLCCPARYWPKSQLPNAQQYARTSKQTRYPNLPRRNLLFRQLKPHEHNQKIPPNNRTPKTRPNPMYHHWQRYRTHSSPFRFRRRIIQQTTELTRTSETWKGLWTFLTILTSTKFPLTQGLSVGHIFEL